MLLLLDLVVLAAPKTQIILLVMVVMEVILYLALLHLLVAVEDRLDMQV
jgi:hypothetical protein